MTDLPTDEICELWVFVREFRVKPDGQPTERLPIEGGGVAVELLALQAGPPEQMGTFVLPEGRFQFIEILLDQDLSYVIEKVPDSPGSPTLICPLPLNPLEQQPLQIPSEKFKINGGPFDVVGDTEVLIDFDAGKSLKRKGSEKNPKGWQLNPKVSIVSVTPGS
jgi:hypothetical protein